MALTKVYPRMVTGIPISVMDFGAVSDGSADCSSAFNAAINAGVKTLYVPSGTYYIENTIEIPSDMVIYGDGVSSVIESNVTNDAWDDQVNGLFCAKNQSNIVVTKLKMAVKSGTAGALKCKFINCENVTLSNCQYDGTITGNISGTALQIFGGDDISIDSCKFYELSSAVYVVKSNYTTGTNAKTTRFNNCSFINTIPSTTNAYPVSIYAYYGDTIIVDRCYFEGIDSTNAVSGARGYYYYSGDGSVGKSQIINSTFVGDASTASIDIEAIRGNESTDLFISDCNFDDFTAVASVANSTRATVQDCYIVNCGYGIHFGNSDGSIHKAINNYFYNLTENALRYGGVSGDYGDAGIAKNNTIIDCDNGGIFFGRVNYGIATGNTIINANRLDTADSGPNVQGYTGIAFYPVNYGYVDGNRIENIGGATGHCKYGVGLYTTNMEVQVTRNNYFNGMEVGAVKNAPTTTPGAGTWLQGVAFDWWAVSPSGVLGTICTTSGTSGTLSGVTGSITSGTTSLTVSDASNLLQGQHITIAGVTGIKIIVGISGTTITIDSNADATVSSAAVAFSAPVWKNFGSIAS